MSFESPSGVPAPEDAAAQAQPAPLVPPQFTPPDQAGQPFQGGQPNQGAQPYQQPAPPYQGAPPFQGMQGMPQNGGAAYPPYGATYGGYQVAPTARPSAGLPIALLALAGLYIVLCLVEIFALSHRVSLANQLISDPTSVTIDQANSADHAVSTLSLIAIVVFLGLIIVLAIWQRSLRSALAPTGRYQQVLKESRYQLLRGVWLISILLAVVLRGSGNLDTPQDVVSHDHQYMVYFAIRAALGGLIIFLVLQLKRASDKAFAVPLPPAGYGAGGPAYPQR